MANLRAGVARVTITPPIGIPMWGFGNRAQPAQSVHDDLTATALVLDDGNTRLGIVAADVIALEDWHVAEIRARAAEAIGIPADNVLIALSHTHSGPLTWRGHGYAELVDNYCSNLTNQLVGALGWAARTARPARLGFGRGDVQIQVNRREKKADGRTVIGVNPEGPVDREVGIVRIDGEDGAPVAALLNYACHPVILGPKSYALSADFVGRTRQVFEAATGAPLLFLQGCTGDLNPLGGVTDRYDNCAKLGAILAGEALKTYEQISEIDQTEIRARRRVFDLPLQALDPLELVEREIAGLRDRLATLRAEGATPLLVQGSQFLLTRAERVRAEVLAGRTQHALPFEVQALLLGDTFVTAAPAELFVEIGLEIKRRSIFPNVLTLGYANGCVGYVPMPAAYPDGGYEVEVAHKGYGKLAAVAPTAAQLIVDYAVSLIDEIA
ncbi:MAG TPA: neutral/alkaline non-lysosomal ceramidase N-terminal domain-containing protein [Chloroflexota bacterium]|nr:neutral/alkaline non-lysosomal ceramidase N-terminal domain-containing protein [Chloroflexota bacterium]